MNETTLVIGDPHVEARDEFIERFDILGQLITEVQPDNIVQLGDFLTYDSISAHNNNKRLTMEGQRLRYELEAGETAYNKIMSPIRALNNSRRANRKALYYPKLFWVVGNHEDRACRYVEQNPEMEGMVEFENFLDVEDDGWVVVPYREHCELNGILFTHIPMNGNNSPIGSKHAAKNILAEYDCSIVYGHTHKLIWESYGIKTTAGTKRITALNAGCYFTHLPEYAAGSAGVRDWWSGLCLLHHHNKEGDYDLETLSMERLVGEYA